MFKGEKEISNDQTNNPTDKSVTSLKQGDEGETLVTQSDDQLDVVNWEWKYQRENEQIENMTWMDWRVYNQARYRNWVDFRGCEKNAKEIFLKINNKQHNRDIRLVTVKKKGLTELKRLKIDSKLWRYCSRSKEKIYL